MIGIATRSLHYDEESYKNADTFEPFRFFNMRDSEADEAGAKCQFVSTAIEYLSFGYGRHAWYGRSLSIIFHGELTHLIV